MKDHLIHESTKKESGAGLAEVLIFLMWIAIVFFCPGLALFILIAVACSR